VAPPQTQDTHGSKAADVGPNSAEALESDPREEEAFDWEQGPSAWSPPPTARASLELPGAVELDQAMAAFEVGAWSKETAVHHDPRPSDESGMSEDAARGKELPPQNVSEHPLAAEREPVSSAEPFGEDDADWLRGRRGPAANAYRRLRRLFP